MNGAHTCQPPRRPDGTPGPSPGRMWLCGTCGDCWETTPTTWIHHGPTPPRKDHP